MTDTTLTDVHPDDEVVLDSNTILPSDNVAESPGDDKVLTGDQGGDTDTDDRGDADSLDDVA